MKFKLLIPVLLIATSAFSQNKQAKVYEPTWESLATHKMPAWFDDAKIGLSKHWGVYSVPAWAPRVEGISYAEWYWNKMMDPKNPTYNYHRENYGNKTYDDFIPQWKAESYNPGEWAKFAKKWAPNTCSSPRNTTMDSACGLPNIPTAMP